MSFQTTLQPSQDSVFVAITEETQEVVSKTEKKSSRPQRLLSVDLVRGFLIFYVIILHPLIQRVFGQESSEFAVQMNTLPKLLLAVGVPFILISLWGTYFTFLTGLSTAYQVSAKLNQYSPESIGRKQQTQIHRMLIGRMVNAGLILMAHLCFVLIFSNMSPELATNSILTGTLETHSWSFSFIQILTSSTLESIAFSSMAVTGIIYILWKRYNTNSHKIVKILAFSTICVWGISGIVSIILPDPVAIGNQYLNNNQLIQYYLFMRFFGVRFSVFPVLTFALFGTTLGYALASKISFKKFCKLVIPMASIPLGYFMIRMMTGFDVIAHFADENVPFELQSLNVGLQALVLLGAYGLFDILKIQERHSSNHLINRLNRIFLRYNANSLTIFVIEPFISIIIYNLFNLGYTGIISENAVVIVAYELTVVFTWFIGLKLWKKYNFKYNFEWMIGQGKKRIMKQFDEAYEPFVQFLESFPSAQIFISNLELRIKQMNIQKPLLNF